MTSTLNSADSPGMCFFFCFLIEKNFHQYSVKTFSISRLSNYLVSEWVELVKWRGKESSLHVVEVQI